MKILKQNKNIIFAIILIIILFISFSYTQAEGILLENYGNLLTSGDVADLTSGSGASHSIAKYISFLIKLSFGFGSIGAVVLII
jgi:hypothetical protein